MNDNASNNAGHRAAIPNPALNVFNALVGEWEAVGTHPQIPHTTLRGHASFQWLEGGAFLGLHTTINYPEIPAGTAIFGSDNTKNEYWMLYFDERGVSRKYEVALQENGLKWWRDAPEFSQRYTFTFADQGNTLISKGEILKDGKNWAPDLNLTYTRIK